MNQVNPIASALQQIQAMQTEAAGYGTQNLAAALSSDAGSVSFGELLQKSLAKISDRQALGKREGQAFELGAPNVSLSDVMIDGAEAGIMFQDSLQIRNRLVSAYKTIMQLDL
ncbi:flagellar hook-basal body complex protein FliE [Paraburkholderia xenovorans LB400]|nr:flagellar hook-basal body complex protein FliE [Paraburkholderia xenovorans]AIP37099.1 flagellar hook-basal body complex protein FliE [Paraburkholderia xenovorans LB400]